MEVVSYFMTPIDVPIHRVSPCDFSTFTFLAFNEKLSDFNMCGEFSPFEYSASALSNEIPTAGNRAVKINTKHIYEMNLRGGCF